MTNQNVPKYIYELLQCCNVALIVVDMQNDFTVRPLIQDGKIPSKINLNDGYDLCHLNGGSLYVPEAEQIIGVINSLLRVAKWSIFTKDWHPCNHISFASNSRGKKVGDTIEVCVPAGEAIFSHDATIINGCCCYEQFLWPNHSVQCTWGAKINKNLCTNLASCFVLKGDDPAVDSYSAFFNNCGGESTGLNEWLSEHNINTLIITGVETAHCPYFTALDALNLGYKVIFLLAALRGISQDTSNAAIQDLRENGACIV